MVDIQTLQNNQLYYSIYDSFLGDCLKFLIGDNKFAVFGLYSYGFNHITGGLLRLNFFGNPNIYHESDVTHIHSNSRAYIELKIGDIDYKYFMDINNLINIYKIYKKIDIKKYNSTCGLIIENTISITNYKMSFLELIMSKKLISEEEMKELSYRLNIEELFNLYYN